MRKKFGAILALSIVGSACIIAGCSGGDELDQYKEQGYAIKVTYDANGGSFTGRTGVTVIDLFNPDHYEEDADGKVHIQLTEPTDPSRTAAGAEIKLTMSGCFFAGWYQTREVVTNEAGKPVDVNGAELEERNGAYYLLGSETVATPAYSYDGYWDFTKDTIDYSAAEEEDFAMTLYAGWLPNYSFEYYYQNATNQEWTLAGTTVFDYKATNAANSDTHDWDTIQLPDWKDGAMNYEYRYANQQIYKFPNKEGETFVAAYTDSACTQEITEKTFTHTGTLDYEHCVAINPVQKIYVKTKAGTNYYRIDKAEDLSKHGDLKGNYVITADLDFTDVKWPAVFGTGTFTGSITTENDKIIKISNVTANHNSTATVGGMFAKIGKDAVLKNLTFENATLNFNNTPSKKDEASFGLFAGYIEDGATLSNITVGGAIRIGKAQNWTENYDLHLCANGNRAGITRTTVKVSVYGEYLWAEELYDYVIDVDSVTVENDYVLMSVSSNVDMRKKAEAEYLKGEY